MSKGVSFITGDKARGWKLVQKNVPKIIDYGRAEGILQPAEGGTAGLLSGIIAKAQEEGLAERKKQSSDKVNLPTNDISTIHEAIPFLPVPAASFCLLCNIVLPGSGTALSGVFGLCMGQPRINFKEGRAFMTLVINVIVGFAQLMTITFMLVGWFWSIAWGSLLLIHSFQYREALRQRRQEAVATAAIEALTKDSILHRRDVKALVKDHKNEAKDKRKKPFPLKFGRSKDS